MPVPFLFALAVITSIATYQATAQVRSVHLQAPRPFGYFIGDVVRLEADIIADAPFTLLPGSLPKPRAINYWLDLRVVAVDERGVEAGARKYRIAVDYQTFYAPLEPRSLTIPGFTVTMTDGNTRVDAAVPAWSFLMSPLREIRPQRSATPTDLLRADAAPHPVPITPSLAAAIGCGAAALVLLGALAHHYGWWPFSRSRRRPFARSRIAVRHALARSAPAEGYLAGLVALHRAFDETAGHSVMAEDAHAFVARAPAFAALEPEIVHFFEASRRAFFAADPAGAMATLPPDALTATAGRLAVAERAAA